MRLAIQKMHGAGNRILVVDRRNDDSIAPSADLIQGIKNTELGDGFDQLMWLGRPRTAATAASYRVFNSDGSEVEQCGNGIRCVAVWLASRSGGPGEYRFDSPSGIVEARVIDAQRASVSMGLPVFDDSLASISVADVQYPVSVVSMGNPHCVLDVADVNKAEVGRLGPAIERHPFFPQRCNVGFMQLVSRTEVKLRVFERGAGETQACGTGACAAVASGRRRGLLDEEVAVQLPGGELVVSWRGANEPVWLTGNAELIREGIIDL